MNGILPLWKPKGMTSHDCVLRIRTLFNTKKVGHTGTLDPDVEGVLGICINQATKLVPYLTEGYKTYTAEVTLGTTTETEDASGAVVEQKEIDRHITNEEIQEILERFLGNIVQVPPMYSAVSVGGKRLYEYARANEYVERPKRNVTIYSLSMIRDYDEDLHSFSIEVTCSQGTYIRTLCVEIGEALGYPAHMSSLVRTEASTFSTEETISFEQLNEAKEKGTLQNFLYPLQRGIGEMEQVEVDAPTRDRIYHGNKLPIPSSVNSFPFAYVYEDRLLAIYEKHPSKENVVKPVRVFNS